MHDGSALNGVPCFAVCRSLPQGKHLPTSLVLSSVHRKALCENLIALYNAHFLTASLLSGAGNAALAHLHPHVAAAESRRQAILREIERERKRKKQSNPKRGKTKKKKAPTEGAEGEAAGEESSSSEDDALEDEDEDLRPPLTGGFSVLTTSANAGVVAEQVRTLRLEFEHSDLPHSHPAEQFLSRLPPVYDFPAPVPASEDGPPPPAPRNVMHRAGYMWLMRPGWSERERDKRNRPCATYNFQDRALRHTMHCAPHVRGWGLRCVALRCAAAHVWGGLGTRRSSASWLLLTGPLFFFFRPSCFAPCACMPVPQPRRSSPPGCPSSTGSTCWPASCRRRPSAPTPTPPARGTCAGWCLVERWARRH